MTERREGNFCREPKCKNKGEFRCRDDGTLICSWCGKVIEERRQELTNLPERTEEMLKQGGY